MMEHSSTMNHSREHVPRTLAMLSCHCTDTQKELAKCSKDFGSFCKNEAEAGFTDELESKQKDVEEACAGIHAQGQQLQVAEDQVRNAEQQENGALTNIYAQRGKLVKEIFDIDEEVAKLQGESAALSANRQVLSQELTTTKEELLEVNAELELIKQKKLLIEQREAKLTQKDQTMTEALTATTNQMSSLAQQRTQIEQQRTELDAQRKQVMDKEQLTVEASKDVPPAVKNQLVEVYNKMQSAQEFASDRCVTTVLNCRFVQPAGKPPMKQGEKMMTDVNIDAVASQDAMTPMATDNTPAMLMPPAATDAQPPSQVTEVEQFEPRYQPPASQELKSASQDFAPSQQGSQEGVLNLATTDGEGLQHIDTQERPAVVGGASQHA